ncbi:MAG TPA: type IX secretion system protein PorQ [Prolixibacteraceae bacterium]|nr:type IX secretion system protein PorQ [Prolixibacteraceae bacterium]
MQLRVYLTLLSIIGSLSLSGQIGGESTYQFLNMSNSARIAALGGIQVAINDSADLNLAFYNPGLLKESCTNQLLMNYVNYLTDINVGYVSYGFSLGKYGTMAAGMHYINYGKFIAADENGVKSENGFSAGEYALNIIWSKKIQRWNVGANLKPVLSGFESYRSFGIAADIGASLLSVNNRSSFGLVARNIGTQITSYYEGGKREAIPFELLAGFSQKLAHAPLVLSVTARQLNHWNLARPDEDNTQDEFNTEPAESFGKQFMRHLLLGAEILPSPNFTLRLGYDYHLRQEMKLEEKLSTVGFSLGFGVKIKRFRLDYSTTRFHVAGSSNLISLAFNLNNTIF